MKQTDSVRSHLSQLRKVLLSFRATGSQGFEGLIGTALSYLTGMPFRLAGSGSQFGVDGRSAYDDHSICFECKRYDGPPRTEAIMSKLGELSLTDGETELWILCATAPINTQLAKKVRLFGSRFQISTAILDWSDHDLPPLAVALAIASERALEFIDQHTKKKTCDTNAAANAFDAITSHPDFRSHSNHLKRTFTNPVLGFDAARYANTKWLNDTFCDRNLATSRLGQPLAPGDPVEGGAHPRRELTSRLIAFLQGPLTKKIVCITGDEGVGKSWIVAQAWLEAQSKPLMVVLPLSDVAEVNTTRDARDAVITSLFLQTEHGPQPPLKEDWYKKWSRIFARQAGVPGDQVRFVVVIDGLNQRPEMDWGRTLSAYCEDLYEVGGRLIVTSARSYFRDYVRRRLTSDYSNLEIPGWRNSDIVKILSLRNIPTDDLSPQVISALQNPRILGVLIHLWMRGIISSIEEVSVSRLMFEHIRFYEKDGPERRPIQDAIAGIRAHASKIVRRMTSSNQQDLVVCDGTALEKIAGEAFFEVLEDDPTQYRLNPEILPLALSLLVIHCLRYAVRNNLSVAETLDGILEPVATTEFTAEVIVSAIMVACVDNSSTYDDKLVVALIRGFAGLHNPRTQYVAQLVALAKAQTLVFAKAARCLCLTGGRQSNFDLIARALLQASNDSKGWIAVSQEVMSWLASYDIRRMDGSAEEIAQNELSGSEEGLLKALRGVDGDTVTLWRLAFAILSIRGRAAAAPFLVRCAFAMGMTSDYFLAYREFVHLIRFNRIDWTATRREMLKEGTVFEGDKVSSVGRSALVRLLNATGDPNDAVRARSLIEPAGDRPLQGRWRLVEEYCATDPCDPESLISDNMRKTGRQYAAIEFGDLYASTGRTTDSLFFDMARPAMARFDEEVAVAKHLEFVDGVISGIGEQWHANIQQLLVHNALFTDRHVGELGRLSTAHGVSVRDDVRDDRWITSQYCLKLSFPFLRGSEQIDALIDVGAEPMMGVIENLHAVDEETLYGRLSDACIRGAEREQFYILLAANVSEAGKSLKLRPFIRGLLNSNDDGVRAQALKLASRLEDHELLSEVVGSGWRSSGKSRYDEICYGSMSLVMAGAAKLIEYDVALRRVASNYYGFAAMNWEGRGVSRVARLLDESVQRACDIERGFGGSVEIKVRGPEDLRPMTNVSTEAVFSSIDTEIERHAVGEEEFRERYERLQMEFKSFAKKLEDDGCRIVLDYIGLEEFRTVTDADQEMRDRWCRLFGALSIERVSIVHNLIVLLGYALGYRDPKSAVSMFDRVNGVSPMVRVLYGAAGVSLESMCIWSGPYDELLNARRFQTLDKASSDYELSQETLAAHLAGKSSLVQRYVEGKLEMVEPAERARGIMVAGLSDSSVFNDGVLEKYCDTAGFVGESCLAGLYAYERNKWSRHWFEKMCGAKVPVEFWTASVQFLKVVDGRFDFWGESYLDRGEMMIRLWPNIRHEVENRVGKWRRKRRSKLFGGEIPREHFLI